MATYLVFLIAWGNMSPQMAQMLALHSVNDAKRLRWQCKQCDAQSSASTDTPNLSEDLLRLARLGGQGKHPENVSKEFFDAWGSRSKLPFPFEAQITFKSGVATTSMMLPHELFATIYHQYPVSFKKRILGAGPEPFWDAVKHHPQMTNHPLKLRGGYKKRAIPIGFHGDGVPVTGIGKVSSRLMDVFSWTSILSGGKTIQVNYLIWGVYQVALSKGDVVTLDEFFTILKWSLEALNEGKWPRADHHKREYNPRSPQGKRAGTALAAGYFGVLWGIMGDLDYFASDLGLPRFSAASPCTLCRCCNEGPAFWSDFRQNAAWIEECWTNEEWLAWDGRSTSPLFTMPGVTGLTVALDYMHCKYLGMDQYMFGSVMYVLCYFVMPDEPLNNLKACWTFIQAAVRVSTEAINV
jgi:hypothetical protein